MTMCPHCIQNLYFDNNLILSADTTNPVYYQTLTLTVNGEEYTFYCPLFDDGFAGWTLISDKGEDLHQKIQEVKGYMNDENFDETEPLPVEMQPYVNVINENQILEVNPYGPMDPEAFYRLPTFISYIGYILVETQNIDGIELTPTLGIDYSESAAAITDSPKI